MPALRDDLDRASAAKEPDGGEDSALTAAREALRALRQQVEDSIGAAQTDSDADGWITAYHFKTGAIHRLLAKAREPFDGIGVVYQTGRSVSDRPPASESPGPLAALREHRTILLDGVQSHDCAGRGECWCDDAWRVLGIPWGRVDLARAALRESSAERGGEER